MNHGRRRACSHTLSRTPRSTHIHTHGLTAALQPEHARVFLDQLMSMLRNVLMRSITTAPCRPLCPCMDA